ncbi:MAG: hypothetical protein AB1486_08940 [Planctomycetota bacterium]
MRTPTPRSWRGRQRVVYRDQVLGPTAIATLRRVLAQHRGRLGRLGLARKVCAAFGWVRPDGGWAARSCLSLLVRLDRRGIVKLPPARRASAPRREPGGRVSARSEGVGDEGAGWAGCFESPAGGPSSLLVRPVRPAEVGAWRRCLERYHYLGDPVPVGEWMRYVAFFGQQPIALLAWRHGEVPAGPRS